MKEIAKFMDLGAKINPEKVIKYGSVVEVIDNYIENIDLTLDKIKVS